MLLKLFPIPLFFILTFSISVESRCTRSCTALASYYVPPDSNLTFISELFNSTLAPSSTLNFDSILSYNKQVANKDNVERGTRLNVPFPCDCINSSLPAHEFSYRVRSHDTYDKIATEYYSNLTTVNWLLPFNTYPPTNIPDTGTVRVVVNCSCGDATISKDYGLFVTYPLRPGENLSYVLTQANLSSDLSGLVQRYNPGVNFSSGAGLVFIPGRDANGNFPPIQSSTGDLAFRARISGGVIAGISIAVIVVLLLLGIGVYIGFFRKKVKGETLSSTDSQDLLAQVGNGNPAASLSPFPFKSFGSKAAESTPAVAASPGLTGISVDKSVEFSYEELALATDNFSMAKKIGEGGFGAVYYANLRGEEAAIKKMDMQATKEFLAELKVLTHVHHLNLVRLIGYCVEGSLFLVYEYIENGNLSQHLRGSGREPLPWSTRVQIALDSARGLEYIHEHTVPVYIHRDIKSANILIDKKFRAKVADFGLTKLTEVGNSSLPTRLVGTFGYMPPEYAQYGDVSPKIDVFAFGVVLYELISAKEAIVKANSSLAESKGLVALKINFNKWRHWLIFSPCLLVQFEDGLDEPDPKAGLCKLIDPTLGDNYPLDSVLKMAQLAKACTQENPQLRPSMRSIVVALMTLSSTTEDWDVGTFYENQAVVNLMSGR
ncbi:chitin elicitor receptor kinase 1-like [Gossypium australe]|uniref:non-specific serine/threonine protein kinase n=1 Tax=Gossypium australe TaxID=47621 RepID=A0A5B6W032_9ROSI|nr:chitin elicitor receptor kinase 1-like [Gossypium australe]